MIHKVVIIGSGPAGLTAGIYLSRSKLKPLIIEGNQPGGQLTTTSYVENWPGETKILGPELMIKMKKHAEHYGSTFLDGNIVKADFSKKPYTLFTESGKEIQAESIIIATGASHKKLNVPGEQEYWGKGVTTCATCDGPFYQDKDVVIAGGGNTAVTEASFLTRFAKKITLIQMTDQLTATDPIKDDVLNNPKIEIIYNNSIKEIKGDGQNVTEVVLDGNRLISTSGVFIAIGFNPNTSMFKDQLKMDSFGYLELTENTKTSKPGIFAAGDVADYKYMQAITAAGFGCMTALDCEAYLREENVSS